MIKCFQKLNKATRATINLEKTTVLPINTDYTINIPNEISIKQQHETIKILRIYFNEDLKYVSQVNWEVIMEKMENQINKLSSRTLSLYSKVIIINTLILSKTLYLSNVFPIDVKTTDKIHRTFFNIYGAKT